MTVLSIDWRYTGDSLSKDLEMVHSIRELRSRLGLTQEKERLPCRRASDLLRHASEA